jgi:hypothetical protein
LVFPEINVVMPLGDAEASIAIIETRTALVRTSVAIFGTRCDVWLVNIFLNEPLFMLYKITGSDHASAYDRSTITQLCCPAR